MELPENYENWIEFAKGCNEVMKKHPYCDTIKLQKGEVISEFRIEAVKAKAFDEVMGNVDFNFGHVMQFKDAALSRGTHFDAINSITDLLLSLINDR